jgi:hypothetical protein
MNVPAARALVLALMLLSSPLFALALLCSAEDQIAGDFGIGILSVSGKLELDRPSSIVVLLHNNGSSAQEAKGLGLYSANASSIVAILHSQDDRIKMLSGPQMAGSLAPGEDRRVQFTALVKGAEVGVYPLMLELSYSRLSSVSSTGDRSLPDISFVYEKIAQEIPLQAEVVQGAKIRVSDLFGNAMPARQSELEIVLTNIGDEAARGLRVQAYPLPPFLSIQNSEEQMNIQPTSSARTKLQVFADENASPGYYVLPCKIFYRDGEERNQDIALVVPVQNENTYSGLMLPAAGLLLLAGAILGARRILGQKKTLHRSPLRLKR